MNEQFKKLREQARVIVYAEELAQREAYETGFHWERVNQIFAELIVKKCSEICMSNQFGGADNYNNGSVSCSELIKHNFGIE